MPKKMIWHKNYQFILSRVSREKKKSQMEKYLTTKYDCYQFADFFKDINIEVNQYHFFFIFQAGLKEDSDSMEFCQNNGIECLKYCVKDKNPLFSNSSNKIIDSLGCVPKIGPTRPRNFPR